MIKNIPLTGQVRCLQTMAKGTFARGILNAPGAVIIGLCACSAHAAPGDLDTAFGQNGFAFVGYTTAGFDFSTAYATAIQPDGKIVVAGHARPTGVNFNQSAAVLARLNVNGTLDTTFGTSGKVIKSYDV